VASHPDAAAVDARHGVFAATGPSFTIGTVSDLAGILEDLGYK
jgi:hypothetical protein